MMLPTVPTPVFATLGAVFLVLAGASVIRITLTRLRPGNDWTELRERIRSWWVMIALLAIAIVLSGNAALVFFGLVSFLALKEYVSIIPTRRVDRNVLFWGYLSIPFQYYWIAIGWYGMFIIFIPVYVFLLLPVRMVIGGEPRNFLRAVGTLQWGVMLTVFSISHIAYLLMTPTGVNPGAGGAGLVLYLLILTEGNDVAQYLFGKTLGRRRVVPNVSPKKTLGGFLGGVATTVALAIALAGPLTPLSPLFAAGAGLLIGVAGFAGDVTLSALKRDLGVKDSGSLIPGHGGILDRIDSLTYTAPLFFHFVRYFFWP